MGWPFHIFRSKSEDSGEKKELETLQSNLSASFARVRADIEKVGLWIRYFAQENLSNRQEHSYMKGQLDSHSSRISELKEGQRKLAEAMEKNAEILEKLSRRIAEMEEKASELQGKITEMSGTSQGTRPGHVRDKSEEEKKIQRNEKNQVQIQGMGEDSGFPSENHIVVSRFTPSELEVIRVLHYTEKPLGYSEIAKLVGKSEKSIRNTICELRKKGIEILDRPIGNREKGFYLAAKTKLLISGR